MSKPEPCFNRHFDKTTNALVGQLIAHQPNNRPVRQKRNRKSRIEPYLAEILKKRDSGWSYQRIADYLKKTYEINKLDRSTVWSRINEFNTEG